MGVGFAYRLRKDSNEKVFSSNLACFFLSRLRKYLKQDVYSGQSQ
jgi:hypothetical protein